MLVTVDGSDESLGGNWRQELVKHANQRNHSLITPPVFDRKHSRRKALTIVKVCKDLLESEDRYYFQLLYIGIPDGIFDSLMADHSSRFVDVDVDVDVDEPASLVALQTSQFD